MFRPSTEALNQRDKVMRTKIEWSSVLMPAAERAAG